jgi:hypothetical protein
MVEEARYLIRWIIAYLQIDMLLLLEAKGKYHSSEVRYLISLIIAYLRIDMMSF